MRGVILILVLIMASPLVAGDYLVANTHDWHSIYLLGIYAGQEGHDLIHFGNLEEAHLKTQTIPKDAAILAYSSGDDAVLKNYGEYLDYKGYQDFDNREFDGYHDLQSMLFGGYERFAVLDHRYGVEALAAAPVLLAQDIAPLFIDEENQDEIEGLVDQDSMIIGSFPVRMISSMDGEKITGRIDDNMREITKRAFDISKGEWGLISKADEVDPTILLMDKPNLVYYGDVGLLAEFIGYSDITNYEAVGGNTANIIQNAEEIAGKDLKVLMRFGRAYTKGSREDKVFDLDTVRFGYPYGSVAVLGARYYPSLGKTVIRYHNDGNTRVQFYSNMEHEGTTFSDDNMHSLGPGMTLEIPYNESVSGGSLLMTTEYGYGPELEYNMESDDGDLFVEVDVGAVEHSENPKIEIVDHGYDNVEGIAFVELKNPNKKGLQVFGELVLEDRTVQSSGSITIAPGDTEYVLIRTPYHMYSDIIAQDYDIFLYYGEDSTLHKKKLDLVLEEKNNQITGSVVDVLTSTPSIAILVILIIAAILGYLYYSTRK